VRQLPDGRLCYALKRPFGAHRVRELVVSPIERLHRLAAQLPKPYLHLTRNAGVFAPPVNQRQTASLDRARTRRDHRLVPRNLLLSLAVLAAGSHLVWPFAATGAADGASAAEAGGPRDTLALRDAPGLADGVPSDSLRPDALPSSDVFSDGSAATCAAFAGAASSGSYWGASAARHTIAGLNADGLLLLHVVLEGNAILEITQSAIAGLPMSVQCSHFNTDANLTVAFFTFSGTAPTATIELELAKPMALWAAWTSWRDARVYKTCSAAGNATGSPEVIGTRGLSCRVVDFVVTRSATPLVPGPGQVQRVTSALVGGLQLAVGDKTLEPPVSAWTTTWSTGSAPWIAIAARLEPGP
jgi:hypothetical protein